MGRARHEEGRRQAPQRSYPRAARLNALLHEVLADELERIADNDDRLGLLTLTGVACEPDLRHAIVFVASLSDEARGALEDHRRELQAAVGAQVRTRRVPTLSFEADPAIEAARRVEEALRRAREHDATMPPPTGAGEEVGGAADDPDRAGTGRAAAPERPTPAPGSP